MISRKQTAERGVARFAEMMREINACRFAMLDAVGKIDASSDDAKMLLRLANVAQRAEEIVSDGFQRATNAHLHAKLTGEGK